MITDGIIVQLKEGIINKFGSHVYENLELDLKTIQQQTIEKKETVYV